MEKRFLWQTNIMENKEKKFLEDTWACNDNQCYKDLHLSFNWIQQEQQNLDFNFRDRINPLNTKDFEREKYHIKNCIVPKRNEDIDVSIVEKTLSPVYLENEKTPLYAKYDIEDSVLLATNNNGTELTGKKWLKDKIHGQDNSVLNLLPKLYKYKTQTNGTVSQQSNYNKEVTEATKSIGENIDKIRQNTDDKMKKRLDKNYKEYQNRLKKLKNEIKVIGNKDLQIFLDKIEELKQNNIDEIKYKEYIEKLEETEKHLEEEDIKKYLIRLKELEKQIENPSQKVN